MPFKDTETTRAYYLKNKEKPKITFDDLPNDITELIFVKRYEIMKKEKQEK